MITQQDKDRILEAETSDIVEVISKFVTLKKKGAQYVGRSPFTTEKTPSFFVVPAKRFFKCFSSGKAGDVITFLEEHEKFSFIEALEYLAEKANIQIAHLDKGEIDPTTKLRSEVFAANEFAHKRFMDGWYTGQPDSIAAANEVLRRGYTEEMILRCKIGFASSDYKGLTGSIDRPIEHFMAAGLINYSEEKKIHYDYFRNRIIFPVYSISDKLVGFTGRTMQDLTVDKTAKFLHSKTSAVFDKGRLLYGLIWSKRSVIESDRVYFVEGPWDYHAMYESGVQNTVSSWGTSVTEEQIKLMSRLTLHIAFVFDGDDAGIKAARRALEITMQQNMQPGFVFLPGGHDPDSYRREFGPAELKSRVQAEMTTAIALVFLSGFQATMDVEEKNEAITFIAGAIGKCPDYTVRELLLEEVSRKTGIAKKMFATKLKDHKSLIRDRDEIVFPAAASSADPRHISERKMVAVLRHQFSTKMYCKTSDVDFGLVEIWKFIEVVMTDSGLNFTLPEFDQILPMLQSLRSGTIQEQQVIDSLPVITDFGFFEFPEMIIGAVVEKLIIEMTVDALTDQMATTEDKTSLTREIHDWQASAAALSQRPKQIKEYLDAIDIRPEQVVHGN